MEKEVQKKLTTKVNSKMLGSHGPHIYSDCYLEHCCYLTYLNVPLELLENVKLIKTF